MQGYEGLDDRQPEAETGMRARARALGLGEWLEHVRQELRVDAGAVILHRDLELRTRAAPC